MFNKINFTLQQAAINNLTSIGSKIKKGTKREVTLCEVWDKKDNGEPYLKEYIKLNTGDLITLASKPKKKLFSKTKK